MPYLKSASSNLLTFKASSRNKNPLNLDPEKLYLGIFELQFNKNRYQIFNQLPRIFENIKCHPTQQKNVLGTENALGIVGKLLSYL